MTELSARLLFVQCTNLILFQTLLGHGSPRPLSHHPKDLPPPWATGLVLQREIRQSPLLGTLLADFPQPATLSRGISFDASTGGESAVKRALKAKLLLADSLQVIQASEGAHERSSK